MKKIVLLAALVALGALMASPALALSLGQGMRIAKIKDHSCLFAELDPDRPGLEPIPHLGPAGFVQESEMRTIFRVTSIFDEDDNPWFDLSSTTELTGAMYDLQLAQVIPVTPTDFILDFVPMGRNPLTADLDGDTTGLGITGGVIEVYEDNTKDYTPDPLGAGRYQDVIAGPPPAGTVPPIPMPATAGPYQWVEGGSGHLPGAAPGPGGADAMPTVTDSAGATSWLSMALLDLNYMVGIGAITAPAVAYAPGTVIREYIDLSTGTGHGRAYANIFGGTFASEMERGLAGGLADVSLQFDLNFPIFNPATGLVSDTIHYVGAGYWTIDSEDPVIFGVIPEPATLSLLGFGLVGLGAYRRKRK